MEKSLSIVHWCVCIILKVAQISKFFCAHNPRYKFDNWTVLHYVPYRMYDYVYDVCIGVLM